MRIMTLSDSCMRLSLFVPAVAVKIIDGGKFDVARGQGNTIIVSFNFGWPAVTYFLCRLQDPSLYISEGRQ